MSMSFDTPEAVEFYRMMVIASGAALYINHGIRPNRSYTPTAMRDALNKVTGSNAKNLKAALGAYVDRAAEMGHPVTNPLVLKAVGL